MHFVWKYRAFDKTNNHDFGDSVKMDVLYSIAVVKYGHNVLKFVKPFPNVLFTIEACGVQGFKVTQSE